jgi:50S ribosomal protein L16 3-hydroxylase
VLDSGFDPQQFLREYWQQKPIVMRNFFNHFPDLLEAEELAGMACEDGVESRLIRRLEQHQWTLAHGPFTDSDFTSLPDRDWTLLVQAVDLWLPEVASLKQHFNFIPSWRIDDVMVSYATAGGGVGPHFDHYDVFLVQGSGQRQWQLGARCAADAATENQDGVAILRDFHASDEITLNPGDVLYVPPRIPHWGTALTPSICYSVGFRAPSVAEMLEGFSDRLIEQVHSEERFTDPTPSLPRMNGEIELGALLPALHRLQSLLADPTEFAQFFGSYVTHPRYPELINQGLASEPDIDTIDKASNIQRHPASRFAFLDPGQDAPILLFVDGECLELSRSLLNAVAELCDISISNISEINVKNQRKEWLEKLLELVGQGSLLLPG